MKRLLLSVLLLLLAAVFGYTQNIQNASTATKTIKKCGTMEHLEWMKQQDPTLEAKMQAEDKKFDDYIATHQTELENNKTVYILPVVVHIVYKAISGNNNDAGDITDAMVLEQINQTNKDWGGTNGRSMGVFSSSLRANSNITFCLAKRDPSGNATTGITRTTTTVTSFTYDNKVKSVSTGGCAAWLSSKYFNIWVCDLNSPHPELGGLCGYAQFPTQGINATYGVVIDYKCFGLSSAFGGTSTTATSPYNGGGTLSHEGGHCFNLYHIWGDDGGGCTQTAIGNGSDGCADTPNQANYTYGNHSGLLTDACSPSTPGIMYENFMDYSDDQDYACVTPNQVTRMQAAVSTYLITVANSGNCSGVGIDETNVINNVNIYPNPSNGLLNVNFNLLNPSNVVVSVYNMIGEKVVSYNKENASAVNTTLDLSKCASGVYFVKITSTNQTLTQKISLIR